MDAPGTQRLAWWKHLLILAITVAVVWSIYRKLDPAALVATLQRLRIPWLLAAVVLYGLLLLAATGRWHLAMRLTDTVVHFTASARATLIGHFFSICLFTASIGDLAKSLLYGRWYRFPFPVIFAGAKLDRIMGSVGLLLVWLATLGWAAANGSIVSEAVPDLQLPGAEKLVLALLVFSAVAGLLCLKPAFRFGLRHFLVTLAQGLRRLLRWPRVMMGGTCFGFLAQAGLSFLLALNLQAVTQTSLPWSQVLWLFPIVQVISALPVTVAGLGLREAAAIVLLGFHGVPPEEAVAAGLLSFLVASAWAGVGGFVLWRETSRRSGKQPFAEARTISVVIPTVNEATDLPMTLAKLKCLPQVQEVIVVDGGSTDATREVARRHGCTVLESPPGRGRQLRHGAQHATGDVVMMVHADTWLPPNAGTAALHCLRDPLVVAGGFWKYFREYPHPLLLGSRWRCAGRLVFGRWIAGDQALFVRRDVLEAVGGVPDLELMEEVRLCELLRPKGRLALAGAKVSTSARRFVKYGALRTLWLMNVVMWKYRRGTPPHQLRKLYEHSA